MKGIKKLIIGLSIMALILFSGCSSPSTTIKNIDDICINKGYEKVTDSKYQNQEYISKYVPKGEIAYINVECDNKYIIKDIAILGSCELDKWDEDCIYNSKTELLISEK